MQNWISIALFFMRLCYFFRMTQTSTACLKFKILAECGVSRARTGIMSLTHYDVETPVFIPVGTQVKH